MIHHPVIREWALTVLDFVETEQAKDPGLDILEVVQYKMDLDCAFSLISWRVEDVRLMANEMTDGLTIYHLCGQFGWTGTPSAFQVVTRALAWELAHSPVYAVSGRCILYVDDIWASAFGNTSRRTLIRSAGSAPASSAKARLPSTRRSWAVVSRSSAMSSTWTP